MIRKNRCIIIRDAILICALVSSIYKRKRKHYMLTALLLSVAINMSKYEL